jgi:protein-tyrosine sulfotransferase
MTRPIFIGGAPRSGLTLLRLMMDAHPAISCGPDTGHVALTMTAKNFEATLGSLHRDHFFLEREAVRASFAKALSDPMAQRAAVLGKRRWADKTALGVLVFEQLAKLFPTAQFIHVVRDGRDVAASLLERRWRSPAGALFDQCANPAGAARYWASIVTLGMQAEESAALAGRILRIRYEDLCAHPEEALRAACRFLGEDFDPEMLRIETRNPPLAGMELETADRLRRPVNKDAVGRWRRDLAPADAAIIRSAFASIFDKLGYAVA